MVSHKIFIQTKKGFSLFEILIVLGIFALVVTSLSAVVSMDTFRGYDWHGNRNLIISSLQKARSQSVNNMCFGAGCTDGLPHGVHFESGKAIIFQGLTYTAGNSLNEIIPISTNITSTGLTDVVFKELTGNVTTVGTINLSDSVGHSSVININSEGRISWTK